MKDKIPVNVSFLSSFSDLINVDPYTFSEEANLQYKRDKMVEGEIVMILAGRLKDCVNYNKAGLDNHDAENACQEAKVN